MYRHTALKIGGKAEKFFLPKTEQELAWLVAEYPSAFIIGGGSNLLVSDEGLETVISMTRFKDFIQHEKTSAGNFAVTVGAGYGLTAFSRRLCKVGLSGLEFGFGIPGTIGGAVVMNAGAWGGEIKDNLAGARILTSGGFKDVSAEELRLGYRSSCLPKGAVIVSATFKLESGDEDTIYERMREGFEKRKNTQPLNFPSCGSIFKNPQGGKSAGEIIDGLRLKGTRVGDAQVSELHANFIVNLGKANAKQVFELIKKLEAEAFEKCGVRFEREIKLAGDF